MYGRLGLKRRLGVWRDGGVNIHLRVKDSSPEELPLLLGQLKLLLHNSFSLPFLERGEGGGGDRRGGDEEGEGGRGPTTTMHLNGNCLSPCNF